MESPQTAECPPPDPPAVRELTRRWNLAAEHLTAPPVPGVANHVYLLGDRFVLRVARDGDGGTLRKEATIIPLARAAGVRTPALVAFDPSPELLGASYLVLERTRGDNLGILDLEPPVTPGVYRALGAELARWHERSVPAGDPLAGIERDTGLDLRPVVDDLAGRGHLDAGTARWFAAWLERLAPAALASAAPRVIHGDASPTNVLVTPGTRAYAAVLDWGDAAWADPAADLAKVPLRAVPAALEGYRSALRGDGGALTEPRVLWFHLGWALAALGRDPRPAERTWTAPPAGRLTEILRFFLEDPPPAWAALRPPRLP